jgi:hypothetical protein
MAVIFYIKEERIMTTTEYKKMVRKLQTWKAITHYDKEYQHTPTHEALAEYMGTSRGFVSPCLTALEKDGAIKKDSIGAIVITDFNYDKRKEYSLIKLAKKSIKIQIRTKKKMDKLKKEGVKLGNPNIEKATKQATIAHTADANKYAKGMKPIIKEIQASGIKTYKDIANELNRRGIKSRYGRMFHASSVRNLILRIRSLSPRTECNLKN